MLRKLPLGFVLLFVFSTVTAQENSLKKAVDKAKTQKNTAESVLEIEALVAHSKDEKTNIDAYTVLGDTYKQLEVYDKAYQFYQKALQLAEKNKLTKRIGLFKEDLGNIQFDLGNYTKSLQLHTESKQCFEKINDLDGVIRSKGNIALAHFKNGHIDEAIASFNSILNEKPLDPKTKATALLNLGSIYLESRKITTAIKYYLETLSLIEPTNEDDFKIQVYLNLAESYIILKQYDNAFLYTKKSEKLLQNVNSNESKSNLYLFYAQIYNGKSEFKEAYKNLQLHQKFKELSIKSEETLLVENIEAINKLENQKLDLQIKEQKIKLLQNEKFANRVKIAFLILLLIGILFLLFYLIKRQRKKVESLSHVIHQTEDKLEFSQTKTDKMVLNIVKNNDFIERFKENLKQVQITTKDTESKSELGKLLFELQNFKLINDNKEDLFNQVDAEFQYKLNKKHPSLTEEEQKICVLIYLNLKNKDMAVILNLSIRSVENCRYRIRKKMDLDSNDNLLTVLHDL
ncbi:tetratricopeptide repeat protein [Flavobacterium pedocola]